MKITECFVAFIWCVFESLITNTTYKYIHIVHMCMVNPIYRKWQHISNCQNIVLLSQYNCSVMVSSSLIAFYRRRQQYKVAIVTSWYNYLYGSIKSKRRYGVHPINRDRKQFGECHHLFPRLEEDDQKFKEYFR